MSRKLQLVIFSSFLVLLVAGCGLFDQAKQTAKKKANISFKVKIPVKYNVNADKLCPQGMNCAAQAQPAPKDQALPAIQKGSTIDVAKATGRPKLTKYTNKFRSIEITDIKYEAANNSLSFDLPPVELYLGPPGSQKKDAPNVVHLATIPKIPAGQNKSGDASVDPAGRKASSKQLQKLKISSVIYAKPKVKKGQDLPPHGQANLKLRVVVKFTANPTDL